MDNYTNFGFCFSQINAYAADHNWQFLRKWEAEDCERKIRLSCRLYSFSLNHNCDPDLLLEPKD